MGKTLEQLIAIWKKLGINQKVTVFFLLVAFIAGAAALIHISSRPSYELLYSDLGEGDMAQVASFLKESNVPFRITNGGKTIMVAEGSKYDMRMGLANKGMMPGSGKGLAMFEKATWGTSQMAEQMIKRRAIQEELARTIVRLEQVEWADVQIAQTEPTLFDEDKKPTTAAISLQMAQGASLHPSQVAGICRLVAGSVARLDADNVIVIDSHGNLLSSPQSNTSDAQARLIHDYRRTQEEYLAGQAQIMLDRALGGGRSVVKVRATIDMDRKSETQETFNAEDRVALKEKITSKTVTASETGAGTSEEENEATYAIPKKLSTIETAPGTLTHLDVALIIDPYYTDAEGNEQSLKAEEIAGLEDLVKGAVGYSEAAPRSDTFKSTTMRFHKAPEPAPDTTAEETRKKENMMQIVKYSSSLLAVVIFVVFAGIVLKRLSRTAAQEETAGSGTHPLIIGGNIIGDNGGNGMSKIRNRVKDLIVGDPANAARLLQEWINNNPGSQKGNSRG